MVTEPTNNQWMPFVVSLSNHERPFDKLRSNGTEVILERNEYNYHRH